MIAEINGMGLDISDQFWIPMRKKCNMQMRQNKKNRAFSYSKLQ